MSDYEEELNEHIAELEAELAKVRRHFTVCPEHVFILRAEKAEAEAERIAGEFVIEHGLREATFEELEKAEAKVERLNKWIEETASALPLTQRSRLREALFHGVQPSSPPDDEPCAKCGVTWKFHANYPGCFFFRRSGGGRESAARKKPMRRRVRDAYAWGRVDRKERDDG